MIDAGITAALINNNQSRTDTDALGFGRLLMSGGRKMDAATADKVAKDFESMFVAQMMEQMFGDSLGHELFGDEETDEVYKGMMMDEYGKEIAKAGGIGIADYVKRELLKLQEV